MKKLIISLLLSSPFLSFAQSTIIEPGAIAPKMTTSERTGLSSVSDGMLVFDENTQTYWYRSSGNWVEIGGSSTPSVPEGLPKVTSNYQSISYPDENVQAHYLEINDNGTFCISYATSSTYTVVLRRNGDFERFRFERGNSSGFRCVINSSDEILMAYDSTIAGNKRLKYRMFDGNTWNNPSIASPNFSNIVTYDLCLNDNSNAYLTWTQPDAVTNRVFLSSYNGTSWTHPTTYFNYFNPDWGVASNVHPCSQVNIDMAANNDVLLTWYQNTGSGHAFKAENISGTWQMPSSASDFIEIPPNVNSNLSQVQSVMTNDGNGLITFKFIQIDNFIPAYPIEYHRYFYNLKENSGWSNNLAFGNYTVDTYPSSPNEEFYFSLIETNTSGIFIYREAVFSNTASLTITRTLSKAESSGLQIKTLARSFQLPTLTYFVPYTVDMNSDNSLQYAINDNLNGIHQIFELKDQWDDLSFDYSFATKYINELGNSASAIFQSRFSENNRSRAISWRQYNAPTYKLYLSFID